MDLPQVTDKAGHCNRHPQLEASKLTLWDWEPTQGKARRGKKRTTYAGTLRRDSLANNTAELKNLMLDRRVWRAAIQESRVVVCWQN